MASPTAPPTAGARITSLVISIAAALVILGMSIVPFFTPAWIHGEQDRAAAAAYFGGDPTLPHVYSDAIVHDLLLGGAFDVGADPRHPVLDPKEQAHMRDVRGVFEGLAALIAAGVVVVVVTAWRSRGRLDARRAMWRAIGRGAAGLATCMVAVGVFAVVAFDSMFQIFHELLFPAGSFSFDPATEHLVQLYPDQFWSDTTLALGFLALTLSIVVAVVAVWRARRLEGRVVGDGAARASASLAPRSAP